MMRCLECEAEIAERALVCIRCWSWAPAEYQLDAAEDRAAEACGTPGASAPSASGASVGQQSLESAPDPEVNDAGLAEWVETRRFSGPRLRPGYYQEEVGAFLDEAESRLAGQLSVRGEASAAEPRSGAADPAVEAPDPQVAQSGEQPQDGLTGQPQIDELDLDAGSLPTQNRPATSQTYLIASACLAGSLVSVGLAAAEIAEYAHHNQVGNLAILGLIIGGLAGATGVVNTDVKSPGWARRINTVAAWLALIGCTTLLVLYGGQHGWGQGG